MTVTVIEYTDGIETGRADVPGYSPAGLWARDRIERFNLVGPNYNDAEETYSAPDGKIVRFVLVEEPRFNLLREAITPEEV